MIAKLDSWLRQLFFAEWSVANVRVFRTAIGLIMLAVVLSWLPGVYALFTENGLLQWVHVPLSNMKIGPNSLSIFALSDAVWFVYICYALLLAAVVAFLAGWQTRIASIVMFVLYTSFIIRNPAISYGGSDILGNILLLTLFLDTSAKKPAFVWPVRLMQLQLSVLYIFTAISKLRSATWFEGTKLYNSLMDPTYTYFDFSWLHSYPFIIAVMTTGTIIVELQAGFLLNVPQARRYSLLLLIAFHIGIATTMNVHLFSEIMIACLTCYLAKSEAELLIRWYDAAKARVVALVRRPQGKI